MPGKKLDMLERSLCDSQGDIFSKARRKNFNDEDFIEKWMTSEVAVNYDDEINWTHGMSWAYLFEYLEDVAGKIRKDTEFLSEGIMYWIGYTYKYLCIRENISSKKAYAMFDAEDMKQFYAAFHITGTDVAVDKMLEVYAERQKKRALPRPNFPPNSACR